MPVNPNYKVLLVSHPYRVGVLNGRVLMHKYTSRGWEPLEVDESTHRLLVADVASQVYGASRFEITPSLSCFVRVIDGTVIEEWWGENDIGEPLSQDVEQVAWTLRCKALAMYLESLG